MNQDNPTHQDEKLAEISFKLMDADKLIAQNFSLWGGGGFWVWVYF